MTTPLREVLVEYGFSVNKKTLKAVENAAAGVTAGFQKLANRATLLSGGALVGVFHTLKKLGDQMVKLKSNSLRIGESAEEYQRWEMAGELAGIGAQKFAGRIVYLTKTLGLAHEGAKFQKKAFTDLGINIHNVAGRVRPTSEIMLEMADILEKIPAGAERGAKLVHVFGRVAAATMVPLFSQGRKGLEQMLKAVELTGGPFDDLFVDQMAEAGRNVKILAGTFNVAQMSIRRSLPDINSWLDKIRLTVISTSELMTKTNFLGDAIRFLAAAFVVGLTAFSLANPVLMGVIVGLALMYLAFNEIMTTLRGGKSLISEFLGEGGVNRVKVAFLTIKDTLNQIVTDLKVATGQTDSWSASAKIVLGVFESIPTALKVVYELIKISYLTVAMIVSVVELIVGLFQILVSSAILFRDTISAAFDKVGDVVNALLSVVAALSGLTGMTIFNDLGFTGAGAASEQMLNRGVSGITKYKDKFLQKPEFTAAQGLFNSGVNNLPGSKGSYGTSMFDAYSNFGKITDASGNRVQGSSAEGTSLFADTEAWRKAQANASYKADLATRYSPSSTGSSVAGRSDSNMSVNYNPNITVNTDRGSSVEESTKQALQAAREDHQKVLAQTYEAIKSGSVVTPESSAP